jgi:hypothetical protein
MQTISYIQVDTTITDGIATVSDVQHKTRTIPMQFDLPQGKTMFMPVLTLNKWLADLRSGEYEQTEAWLKKGDGYCCLGVLQQGIDGDVERTPMNGETDHPRDLPTVGWLASKGIWFPAMSGVEDWKVMSPEVSGTAGVIGQRGHTTNCETHSLSYCNDGIRLTFAQIADLIEKSVEPVYTNAHGASFILLPDQEERIVMPEAMFNYWIEDLTSGKFKQAQNALCGSVRDEDGDTVWDGDEQSLGYCCLGVLEMVVQGECDKNPDGEFRGTPTPEFVQANGIKFYSWVTDDYVNHDSTHVTNPGFRVMFSNDPEWVWTTAAELNDNGYSFAQIAEVLKRITKRI